MSAVGDLSIAQVLAKDGNRPVRALPGRYGLTVHGARAPAALNAAAAWDEYRRRRIPTAPDAYCS
jgi:hypothetical protein